MPQLVKAHQIMERHFKESHEETNTASEMEFLHRIKIYRLLLFLKFNFVGVQLRKRLYYGRVQQQITPMRRAVTLFIDFGMCLWIGGFLMIMKFNPVGFMERLQRQQKEVDMHLNEMTRGGGRQQKKAQIEVQPAGGARKVTVRKGNDNMVITSSEQKISENNSTVNGLLGFNEIDFNQRQQRLKRVTLETQVRT